MKHPFATLPDAAFAIIRDALDATSWGRLRLTCSFIRAATDRQLQTVPISAAPTAHGLQPAEVRHVAEHYPMATVLKINSDSHAAPPDRAHHALLIATLAQLAKEGVQWESITSIRGAASSDLLSALCRLCPNLNAVEACGRAAPLLCAAAGAAGTLQQLRLRSIHPAGSGAAAAPDAGSEAAHEAAAALGQLTNVVGLSWELCLEETSSSPGSHHSSNGCGESSNNSSSSSNNNNSSSGSSSSRLVNTCSSMVSMCYSQEVALALPILTSLTQLRITGPGDVEGV